MLKIRNLEAGYGKLTVIHKISMHVSPGEIVTIIGGNGTGKSTLLKTIAGLVKARAGEVIFDQRDIMGMSPEEIVFLGCSLVPEGRQIFSTMTVRENLFLGGYVQVRRRERAKAESDMERVYELFPLLLERQNQLAGTLSGGEQQMLAIGRSLMARPKLIMMDEPSMGLAPIIVRSIFRVIERLRDEGNTVLLVEQNARSALKIANRGYVIESGRIMLQGPAEDLMLNKDIQRAYLGRDLNHES
ncbi:MAG: ATP-binding cassette domain-containing protein [Deltaproteobacteria bacterium]|nr:ATP-binding cassette domain-containing protein [Deltaproteobacteria bacterium]NIS78484.1 ATP-binding cassette domain-containing protein [Deltaproteobacteria bacterium]